MTPDARRLLIQVKLADLAAALQLARADRALKQCVQDSHPTTALRVLQGHDHRVSTLIEIADALDCDVQITLHKRSA